MNSRMSFHAMQMPEGDHDNSDMGPWANRWDLSPGTTGAGASQGSASQVEKSERPVPSNGAAHTKGSDQRGEFS